MNEFEYDYDKSNANYKKHGVDFEDAKSMWSGYTVEVSVTKDNEEPRYRVTGFINDKLWTAIITYRDSRIRIISVRRARLNEVRSHEQAIENEKNNQC